MVCGLVALNIHIHRAPLQGAAAVGSDTPRGPGPSFDECAVIIPRTSWRKRMSVAIVSTVPYPQLGHCIAAAPLSSQLRRSQGSRSGEPCRNESPDSESQKVITPSTRDESKRGAARPSPISASAGPRVACRRFSNVGTIGKQPCEVGTQWARTGIIRKHSRMRTRVEHART
jgi:hypothetical protein